ncbi:low molecular weight protein-tyrosine-phosphatase [Arenibaculum sp.]|uniref:low molecular weight protein-tyrosine-phosphatase n=1 Tax=Arenibaculum sp. TaxID=2865862 RepID=UPI002E135632|nr:low molecular weight protein-tyrosine-phosphatase [Arenibaculum sp.]
MTSREPRRTVGSANPGPREALALRVLFVCTGNICRSPTAEGVFRHLLREAGLEGLVATDSAGTHDYHVGDPPDPRSAACAGRRGIDISGLRARRVRPSDFADFDLILAMDRGHREALLRQAPAEARERVRLFLDYAPDAPVRDVPDPYYGGENHFDETFVLIEAASHGLLAALVRDRRDVLDRSGDDGG